MIIRNIGMNKLYAVHVERSATIDEAQVRDAE